MEQKSESNLIGYMPVQMLSYQETRAHLPAISKCTLPLSIASISHEEMQEAFMNESELEEIDLLELDAEYAACMMSMIALIMPIEEEVSYIENLN